MPGDAFHERGPPLLLPLDDLPVGHHLVGARHGHVAEDVGVPADELVVDAAEHVGDGEGSGLPGEGGVEDHLAGQVAELLLEVLVGAFGDGLGAGRRGRRRQRLDGLDHLVGLLDEVAGQGVVGLLGVPGAAAGGPQPLDEGHEPLPRLTGAARRHLDVHRREVVGLDDAVEVLQGDGGDGLVGQAEPGQDRHRRLAGEALQQRQLHVGEHQRGVAVADEQRAGREGGGERLAVDRPGAASRQRVDAEAEPGEVEERQAGDEDEPLPEPGPEQRHRLLADGGAAGDGEADVAAVGGGGESGGDRLVDLGQGGGGVVDGVEALELDALGGEVGHGRVAGGAHEPACCRHGQERRPPGGQEEICPAGTEPDDDNPARAGAGAGRLPRLAHPTRCVGLPGVPGSSPGSVVVVGRLSVRSVFGFGALGGTTSGGWPVAGGWNVP